VAAIMDVLVDVNQTTIPMIAAHPRTAMVTGVAAVDIDVLVDVNQTTTPTTHLKTPQKAHRTLVARDQKV